MMKRACVCIIMVLTLMLLTACQNPGISVVNIAEDGTPHSVDLPGVGVFQKTVQDVSNNLPVSTDVTRDMTASPPVYVRTDGYHEQVAYPFYTLVQSIADLDAYVKQYEGTYNFVHRETVSTDTTIGLLDAIQSYDETFFASYHVILVVLQEGSGSIRHKVEQMSVDEEGVLSIPITRIVPQVGTCDMAQWHILLPIDKSVSFSSVDIVLSAQS